MVNVYFKTEQNNAKSVQYITGIDTDLALYVESKKPILFLTPLEDKPKSKFEVKDFSVKEIFNRLNKYKEIGLVFDEITAKELLFFKKKFKGKIKDISKEFSARRLVKSQKEVEKISKCQRITEKILGELFNNFSKFKTEFEAFIFLKKKCLDYGVEPAFKPIVASGSHSKNPHYFPKKNSKLNKGFCIIDFGVLHEGYCSDITRTIYLGKPSQKEIEEYNIVLSFLEKVEKEVKAGTNKIETPFKMIHSLGHGIGLDVHEAPRVGVDKLKIGNTIAIEPGKYKKQGIRIEENYLVTQNGLKKLSRFPRDLRII